MNNKTFRSFLSVSSVGKAAYFLQAVLIVILGLSSGSCKEDKDSLSLSTSSIDASLAGDEVEFSILSNATWGVSVADKWAHVDNSYGNGDATITLTIDANDTNENRATTLYVSTGALTEQITISQDAFSLSSYDMTFDEDGTPLQLTVTSAYSWTITITAGAEWCQPDILSGDGDAVVTLTPIPYTDRVPREKSRIVFKCLNTEAELLVSQKIYNRPPESPVLLTPADEAADVSYPVIFTWNPSADPDGDDVSYELYLSLNGRTWSSKPVYETTATEAATISEHIQENTPYYWKVIAKDRFGGKSESPIHSFTTGGYQLYPDGEVVAYQHFSAPDVTIPVNLVIVGDGFIAADYLRGGTFDAAAARAAEAFFSVEPYTTYREYFSVYKVVAYSEEQGATVTRDFSDGKVKAQQKNTVFGSVFEGGQSTGITCDENAVFEYAQKVPEVRQAGIDNTTVIVIINLDVYAGTTSMWSSGQSIAMCPTGDDFEKIVYHEAGGHGFAKLLDEYINHPAEIYPSQNAAELENFRQGNVWSFGANIGLTDNRESVQWKHYFDRAGYEMVDIYEGAALYGKGVWRPEANSCMNDNVPYFNAPSREAIVRRIMSINRKGFRYDEFYAKDNTIYPASVRRSGAAKRPLGPPILKR